MTVDKPFAKYGTNDLYGHKKKVYSLAWNCSGRKLATGAWDAVACIWNIEPDGRVRKDSADHQLTGHREAVEQIAWDPLHENRLATTGSDKTVRIWDARSGKEVCKVNTPVVNISMAWHPEGQHLAVGNKDDVIAIFDLRRLGKPVKQHKNSYVVNEIGFSNDGKHFLQTSADSNALQIYKYPSFELTQSLRGHTNTPFALAVDPTNRYLATGGTDAITCIWDVPTLACMSTFTMRHTPVRSVSFSHNGRYLAVASEHVDVQRSADGIPFGGQPDMLDILDVEEERVVHTIEGKSMRQVMDCVCWNPKHMLLAFPGPCEEGQHHRDSGTYGAVSIFAPKL